MEGLEASSEYETILYQYGGDLRNTDGLLTLNNGTTVKVSVFLLISKSFIYKKQVSESNDAENPITNIATQMSTAEGRIIMKLERNGQNQIKLSGLSITPDVPISESILTAPLTSDAPATTNEPSASHVPVSTFAPQTSAVQATTDAKGINRL